MRRVVALSIAIFTFLNFTAGAQNNDEPTPPEPVLLFEVQAQLVDNTAPYTFRVYGDKDVGTITAYGIEVVSPSGKTQLLQDFESILPANSEADALIVEDLNFDGYADLRLMQYQSGGESSIPFFYWLYHPDSDEFIFTEALSAIKSPTVDQEKQMLISHSRTSSSELTTEYYQLKGYSPQLVRKEVRSYAADGSSKLHIFTVNNPSSPLKLLEVRSLKPGEEP